MAQRCRELRVLCAVGVVAALSAGSVAGAATSSTKWAVGDCYAKADVDRDEVDLSSKVPCTKRHTVQIVGGAPLPTTLASAGLPTLLSATSPVRSTLAQLAALTCNAGNTISNVYRKLGSKLQPLMLSGNVTEFVPASPGRTGWVLPDAASFSAGTTDLLCIWEPDKAIKGADTGDIRQLETKSPLTPMRMCFDFKPDNSGADLAGCGKAHDKEMLILISQLVTGKPARIADWTDADWATFDEACAKFTTVLIGADRGDLLIRADTDGTVSASQGRRMFSCHAYTEDDKLQLPAGTLVGVGKAKIKFPKD